LDDLHWADHPSFQLLEKLVRSPHPSPFVFFFFFFFFFLKGAHCVRTL
jgi:predicted ATPase